MILLKKPVYRPLMLMVIVLLLTTLACTLPTLQNSTIPNTAPLTDDEALQFERDLEATLNSQQPGAESTITINESELSAYLANRMAGDPDQVFSNPRVRMTNGRMEIVIRVQQGFSVDATSVVVPGVDSSGRPRLQVESVSLGSLPVPESMVSQIQRWVDQFLVDYLESTNSSFTITKIEITEGNLLVTGITQ
jgi:uncharacterized protein YpmS